ncbi:MAG: hypothetical protein WBK95_09205 [Sulfurimonas sp.]|jgi:uncharacterized membrane protein|nr:hypothetical protein [Sulfurimonas sp.]MDD5202153.1 hypothetical protein [Sulfurimonas sp.]
MIKKIRLELLYYVAILLVLAIVQHSDLLTAPLERFEQMQHNANYFHPFLYALLIYILIACMRVIVKFILFLKNKFKTN